MNLNTIAIAPHAAGFIKVACEDDPLFGEARTKPEFLITARHHEACGGEHPKLAPHPIAAKLADGAEGDHKVTEIPIRLFFNKSVNALSIRYQAYEVESSHRPICAGDGKNARRLTLAADNTQTMQDVACPGPELCDLVASGRAVCRRQVRMPVQIEGQGDPLSVFEVRTSSLNTYRAMRAQLKLIEQQFGGLRHVPLKLTLWKASNELSGYAPFSLMQLELDAPSTIEAMKTAKAKRDELLAAGINDDIDVTSEEGDAEDPFLAAAMDYPAVSEFYASNATRRAGAEAITSPRAARAAASSSLRDVAAASIAEAVTRGAAPAPAEA